MKNLFKFSFFILIAFGCSNMEPKAIPYGQSECALCNMMVTDRKFGAELITDKGRYYYFDSAECMMRYIGENPDLKFKHILVTHFGNPEMVADAALSYYIISHEIPSPMGEFLSAYPSYEAALDQLKKHKGEIFTFEQLQEKFNVNAINALVN